jgi:hypothetical protein
MKILPNFTMSRTLKITLGFVIVVMGLLTAKLVNAFSIWGPAEAWQTPALDYVTRAFYPFTELGGPKNIGEGSRINVGVVAYAYDETFLTYFGADGVKAIDSAMNILNALPTVTSANSPALTQFLTQGNQRVNYSAQALELYDLKSVVLGLMLEHMGLIGETHTFDLAARVAEGTCAFDYFVVQRNFDPDTLNASPFVNGSEYTYNIVENCAVGDAVEAYVDPEVLPYSTSAVATLDFLQLGGFYMGITRDDMGGLRYLYNPQHFVNENFDPTSVPGISGVSPYTPVSTNTNTATAGGTATTVAGGGWEGTLGGVSKIHFVKVAYDSIVGTTYHTNIATFITTVITNGQVSKLSVTRTLPAPDIIFTAANLTQGALTDTSLTRNVTFVASTVPVSTGGGVIPSVISPAMLVTFNNVGPLYYNQTPSFLSQQSAIIANVPGSTNYVPTFIWGSFDGSTNPPIVFPQGTSLAELEAEAASGGGIPLNTYDAVGSNVVQEPVIYQGQ